jgi:hypothetical protein
MRILKSQMTRGRLIRTWVANNDQLRRIEVRFPLMASIRSAASHKAINKTDTAAPVVTHGSVPSSAWNRNHIDSGRMDTLRTPAPNQVSAFPLRGKRPAVNAPRITKTLRNPRPKSMTKIAPVTNPVPTASQRIFLESGTTSGFFTSESYHQRGGASDGAQSRQAGTLGMPFCPIAPVRA